MKCRILLVAVLALIVAAPVLAEEPPKEVRAAWQNMQPDITIEDHLGNPITGIRCATLDFGPAENPRAPEDLDAWIREHALEKLNVTIPVAVHVLYYLKGSTYLGNVTDTQIANQIAALNATYAPCGVSFYLHSTTRTLNKTWATMRPGSSAELAAKTALAVDPTNVYNLYTAVPGGGLLGWSYLPWSYAESSVWHGTVIHWGSVPGGYLTQYNEGDTAVHECGHYLGLYHTFQGGCTEPNDYCADTPQEATPDYYCTLNRDTCPSNPGYDPIHNFMDYTPDSCMYEFTGDQCDRIEWAVTTYKPGLLY